MQKVREEAGGAKILSWDVVNEAITDGGQSPFKDNAWYPKLSDYVDRAFKYARAADPDALLFYNDYAVVNNDGKADRIVDMIKGM